MRTPLSIYTLKPASIAIEYGDAKAACHAFGMGETRLYQAFNAGLITGVLIKKDKHSPRGKRLFSFASIREWLSSLESSGTDAPKSDASLMIAKARTSRRVTGAARRQPGCQIESTTAS